MVSNRTRRRVLASGGATLAALAGCLDAGSGEGDGGGAATDSAPSTTDGGAGDATGTLPLASESLVVEGSFAQLRDWVRSGGPPKDGIPSIDEPSFEPAGEVGDRIGGGDPVFSVVVDGDARAYPQSILVWHEVVNDTVGGDPIAVTYCPLTGTAIGYRRAGVEFGVSGNLLNSNLVMYDRGTDIRWPQVLGTAIEGEHEGRSLQHVPVRWTTWRRWRDAHPDGRVLTRDTGYVRDYDRDPYGTYNPRGGYYARESTLFDPQRADNRHPAKDVFHGARTPSGASAVHGRLLREQRVVSGTAGEVPVVFVHDDVLDTGHGYRLPSTDAPAPTAVDGGYRLDGETYVAGDLPLEPVPSFDAMWFAWFAFYPSTEVHA
ncbi:DUF3179 domain-containing protein [Haloarchaeobius litoreus]|uniref:DUF3179 domain-containing protein n=1 Tax=Haloarchaeobius litoreus TaxID=755306 RepID=A0ABD6DF34_9EURY|nr:DUF3179 domain-containing protein [Haloarchaeobius litoreus]